MCICFCWFVYVLKAINVWIGTRHQFCVVPYRTGDTIHWIPSCLALSQTVVVGVLAPTDLGVSQYCSLSAFARVQQVTKFYRIIERIAGGNIDHHGNM